MKVLRFDNFNEGLKSGWTDFGYPDFPPGQGPGCNDFYGNKLSKFTYDEINKIKNDIPEIDLTSGTRNVIRIQTAGTLNNICVVYKYEDEWYIIDYNRHVLKRYQNQHIYVADQIDDVIKNIRENI